MGRRRNRNRGRRRGRRGKLSTRAPQSGAYICELSQFNTRAGLSVAWTVASLSPPESRPFRLIKMTCEFSGMFWNRRDNSSTTNVPIITSGHAPGWINLSLYNPSGKRVAVSSARLVSAAPRSVTLFYPREEDWYPENTPETSTFAAADLGCMFPNIQDVYCSGLVRFYYICKSEELSEACPRNMSYSTRPLGGFLAEGSSIGSFEQLDSSPRCSATPSPPHLLPTSGDHTRGDRELDY